MYLAMQTISGYSIYLFRIRLLVYEMKPIYSYENYYQNKRRFTVLQYNALQLRRYLSCCDDCLFTIKYAMSKYCTLLS